MPLTAKGEKIKSAMEREYGPGKGERVFYASKNAGTISGVDAQVVSSGWDPTACRSDPPLWPCGDDDKCDAVMKRLDALSSRCDGVLKTFMKEEAKEPEHQASGSAQKLAAKADAILAPSALPEPTGPTSFRITKPGL